MFETERLLVRNLKHQDYSDLLEQRTDPYVCRYISEPMDEIEVRSFLDEHSKLWTGKLFERLALAVVLKGSDKVIGELMFKFIDIKNSKGEIGFRFNRKYHGFGYAYESVNALITYLFSKLNVKTLVGVCDHRNKASYKLMEKLNMQLDKEIQNHNPKSLQYQYTINIR